MSRITQDFPPFKERSSARKLTFIALVVFVIFASLCHFVVGPLLSQLGF